MKNERAINLIINLFKDKIGQEFTTKEIKQILNEENIYPSDYCYNSYNKDSKEIYLFEKVENGLFKYLGKNYNYNGQIYWKSKDNNEQLVVGKWENGKRLLNFKPYEAIEKLKEELKIGELTLHTKSNINRSSIEFKCFLNKKNIYVNTSRNSDILISDKDILDCLLKNKFLGESGLSYAPRIAEYIYQKYLNSGVNKMIRIKVGTFVQEHLENIINYCKSNLEEIKYLKNNLFGLSYPFIIEQYNIPEGRSRYWQRSYNIENIEYRFCSEFGGSKIASQGKTLSQKQGEDFLNYLKNKKLLLDKYLDKEIEFIGGDTENEVIEKSFERKNINIKNIILYGAPGVGKTHNYKKLISLIEEGKSQKDIFYSIKSNEVFNDENTTFQNIKEENRVEFITFHQSFGYEDFIEGFRPNEEGKIELEDGIFKQISINAKKTNEILDDIRNIDFNDYLNVNQEFRTKHGKRFFIVSIDEDILFEHEKGTQFIAYRNKIINHLLDEETMTNDSYYSSQVYIAREIYKKLNIRKKQQKNFYLIIDEINRGNISKIFGELITLIEESKRDTYEVTLPYSKQKFSVPSNLYIIGTMNTTDKSIALIDVALRRRFTFIKMQPNSDLVLPSFKSIFEKLNEQIKVDLGEEYQIGHSYFMNIDESGLDFVKEYKIKPLLEEYYYGDEKLNEVLKIIGV